VSAVEADARGPLPRTVVAAAAILALYGVVVFVAAILSPETRDAEAGGLVRSGIRCAGLLVTAWGLTRRETWAWWIAVVLAGFWTITGAAALLAYHRVSALTPQLQSVAGVAIAFLVLLAAAVVLLLTPSARRACGIG
jgi:hypothetical protein